MHENPDQAALSPAASSGKQHARSFADAQDFSDFAAIALAKFRHLGMFFLRPYAKFLVIATLGLIFLGGLVKSHEAGLSVPDWPTTFGENMFLFPYDKWEGGIWYEHSHRLYASAVGAFTMLLCFAIAVIDPRWWLKGLGALALVMVIVQGILGGLTVLYALPAPISVSHGVLAQTFLMLLIIIAYALSKERQRRIERGDTGGNRPVAAAAIVLLGVVYAQLIAGAVMRHTEAGLAIPDFPTMGNQWLPALDGAMLAWINDWRTETAFETGAYLPAVTMDQVVYHLLHRVGAVAVIAAAIFLTWRAHAAAAGRGLLTAVWAVNILTAAQATLGVVSVLTVREPFLTSVHVVGGAILLGAIMLTALRAMPVSLTAPARASQTVSAKKDSRMKQRQSLESTA